MVNNTLTVGTAAVQVPLGPGDRPVIINTGSTTIYFGNTSGVTTTNGIPLGANVGYEFPNQLDMAEWDALWVISSGAGGQIRYTTVG
jgi:hypothetical protein